MKPGSWANASARSRSTRCMTSSIEPFPTRYVRMLMYIGAPLAGCRPTLPLISQVEQCCLDAAAHILALAQAELEEDRVDVALDRALRDDKLVGDRRVTPALGDHREDLQLALGEFAQRRVVALGARCDELVDDDRVDERAALGHLADRAGECRRVAQPVLEQVRAARRSTLQQRHRIRRLDVLAEHDDPDGGGGLTQLD